MSMFALGAAFFVLALVTPALALAAPMTPGLSLAAHLVACEVEAPDAPVSGSTLADTSCASLANEDASPVPPYDFRDNFAPMCDVSGASVVAPPRVMAVGDARIQAAPSSCSSDTEGLRFLPGHPDDLQHHQTGYTTFSVVGLETLVSEAPERELALRHTPAPQENAPQGIDDDIDHPPRA